MLIYINKYCRTQVHKFRPNVPAQCKKRSNETNVDVIIRIEMLAFALSYIKTRSNCLFSGGKIVGVGG